MRKREILFDLTPLLDVILILFFSVLLMSTEQIADYLFQIREAEESRIIAEQGREVAEAELHDVTVRLEALSEWDTERLEFTRELDTQAAWRSAIEDAIFITSMNVHGIDGRRFVNISARPDIDETIEIIWAGGIVNRIRNDGFITSEMDRILQSIVAHLPYERPILVLFNEAGIAVQEFNLIYRNVNQFIEANPDFTIRLSVYTQN